ncbi:hypothetical protein B0H13DRAFT_1858994 [Mycena leptocephala]|nr:hypothetical protein B0H13DRAFT_1858994 [Mycena leptocephala]
MSSLTAYLRIVVEFAFAFSVASVMVLAVVILTGIPMPLLPTVQITLVSTLVVFAVMCTLVILAEKKLKAYCTASKTKGRREDKPDLAMLHQTWGLRTQGNNQNEARNLSYERPRKDEHSTSLISNGEPTGWGTAQELAH